MFLADVSIVIRTDVGVDVVADNTSHISMSPPTPPHSHHGRRTETGPSVWLPEVAGGAGSCVRLEKGPFVVVTASDVVVLLGDSALAPPHPAAKTTAAALRHSVIAFLPL
jgi:hypothetical protein